MDNYDTFDENGMFLCSEDEVDVHYKGLWHKVIRIWLYDNEGNLYLRVRKEDNKLDCINELHLLSSESVASCFDRGMFEKLGIHFPATSNIEQAYQRKVKIHRVYSDNSEIRDNYFLCDYIGEFDNTASFFIFSDDTDGLVKVNAKGIGRLLSTRTGEVMSYRVTPNNDTEGEKKLISFENIYTTNSEDVYAKYSNVITEIGKTSALHEKEKKEKEKLKALAKKTKVEDDDIVSHADENEGNEIY